MSGTAKYNIGTIIKCKVVKISSTFILVSFDGNYGIVHISEVSDYLVKSLNDFFTYGGEYNFLLISSKNDKYIFSYKRIQPKLLKIRKTIIPTVSGFENLKKDVLDRLAKEYKD